MPVTLNDLFTRHQLYLEGVKAYEADAFAEVAKQIDIQLSTQLRTLDNKKLDELSKATLLALIVILRKAQARIYAAYYERLLSFFRHLVASDAWLIAKSLGVATGTKVETPDADALWSTIKNAPIPANGLYIPTFVKTFTASAANSIESLVRQGYVNGWSIEELSRNVRGTSSANYKDGALARINNQAAAVIATSVQTASQIVQLRVSGIVFDEYEWVSILDNSTTEICRSRDRRRYRIGQGPLPPAHINCRSHTYPIRRDVEEPEPPKSLTMWAKAQPPAVLVDIFGRKLSSDIQSGMRASDLKYKAAPLTLAEFEAKQSFLVLSSDQ